MKLTHMLAALAALLITTTLPAHAQLARSGWASVTVDDYYDCADQAGNGLDFIVDATAKQLKITRSKTPWLEDSWSEFETVQVPDDHIHSMNGHLYLALWGRSMLRQLRPGQPFEFFDFPRNIFTYYCQPDMDAYAQAHSTSGPLR